MKYDIIITTAFKKDIKKASKQKKNLNLLFEVIDRLSEGQILEPNFKDHKLTGKYEGKRECHIEPDFLLIYQIKEKEIALYALRVGSHSELFN